jgi:hypothetical protein
VQRQRSALGDTLSFSHIQDQKFRVDQANSNLGLFCRLAGIAAFILLVYTLATIVQMIALGGPPTTAAEAFSLLQKNKLVGLLRLDLPTLFAMPLYYILFLGLYAALQKTNRAASILFTALGFAGVTLVLATPSALSMLSLSEKFAGATTDAMRAQYLAAGEAILASDIWHGTGAIIGGILGECAWLIASVVMLRSSFFSKTTAYLGIGMHGLDLAHILLGFFLPTAGVVFMSIAGPLYPIWFLLIGRSLFRLTGTTPHHQSVTLAR